MIITVFSSPFSLPTPLHTRRAGTHAHAGTFSIVVCLQSVFVFVRSFCSSARLLLALALMISTDIPLFGKYIYFRLKMIGCFFPYTRRFFSAAFYWYSRTHTLTRGTLSAICFALSFAYTYLLATATLRLQFPRLPLASCSYYLFARESDLSRPRGPTIHTDWFTFRRIC